MALYARDKGIVLALQTHPEVTGNNEQMPGDDRRGGGGSLMVGLDLPLLEAFNQRLMVNARQLSSRDHRLRGLYPVDARYIDARIFFRGLLNDLFGRKPMALGSTAG